MKKKKNIYMKALCVKLKMSCLMEIRTVWVDVFSVSRNDVTVIFRKKEKKSSRTLYAMLLHTHTHTHSKSQIYWSNVHRYWQVSHFLSSPHRLWSTDYFFYFFCELTFEPQHLLWPWPELCWWGSPLWLGQLYRYLQSPFCFVFVFYNALSDKQNVI